MVCHRDDAGSSGTKESLLYTMGTNDSDLPSRSEIYTLGTNVDEEVEVNGNADGYLNMDEGEEDEGEDEDEDEDEQEMGKSDDNEIQSLPASRVPPAPSPPLRRRAPPAPPAAMMPEGLQASA